MTAATFARRRAAEDAARELYAIYTRKRAAAIRWRLDHCADADRDPLWRAFVTGALWQQRQPDRRAIRAGLSGAEREVPFAP